MNYSEYCSFLKVTRDSTTEQERLISCQKARTLKYGNELETTS